jgi:hypothetical protein
VDILPSRFYSVVEDQDDPKYLIVRVKVAGSKYGPRPKSQRHQTVVTAIAPTFGAMLLACARRSMATMVSG